jgi:hypothetical protein
MTTQDLKRIRAALIWAQAEIHNPGACRHAGKDITELTEEAIVLLNRAITARDPMVEAHSR